MPVINFKNYYVKESYFSIVDSNNTETEFNLSPSIDFDIDNDGENVKKVSLMFECSENLPFKVRATLVGIFEYNEDEDNDGGGFKAFRPNALAILYPYLRNLISQLTMMSNEYPPIILPTVNMYQLVEWHDQQKNKKL